MLLQFVVFYFLTILVFGDDHNFIGIPATKQRLEMEKKTMEGDLASRVAGGYPVPKEIIYPWLAGIVGILPDKKVSICGGTLLTADRLITAAHCWETTEHKVLYFRVVLGTPYLYCRELHCKGIMINTKNVVLHPNWDLNQKDSVDAAMIILPYSIKFTADVYPIALPLNNLMDSFEGYTAIIAGYGRLDGIQYTPKDNPYIYHLETRVISDAECQYFYQNSTIQPYHMCTSGQGGVGICQGDSGGPLVSLVDGKYTLIGIAVLGLEDGCNQSYPSIFTRITSVINFIAVNLGV